MRGILDTSVVLSADVDPIPGELALSAITLAELHFGVLVAKTPDIRAERLRRLVQIEREFDALPVDDDVADGYGRLASAVVLEGRNPRARSMDLLIAATAYAHGARLYTCNPSDFLGLADFIDVVAV